MMQRLPDFFIIGAMKCATTTLHKQLARQPGISMSRLKEPNFFSDDAIYARGFDWYRSLFQWASDDDLCGESSTHYTKLPAYRHTVERLARAISRPKLIYVMRHPVDRLVSQYVHELTTGRITVGLEDAVELHPELIDYGRYSMQLAPYIEAFGRESVLPVGFGRLVWHSQDELERICRFLGYRGRPLWDASLGPQNVGRERLRRSMVRHVLVQAPILREIRRALLPKSWSESIKTLWRARIDPPALPPALLDRLRDAFNPDLARLGDWLGRPLDCDNFSTVCLEHPLDWE
jgi:hypothetical protein